MSSALGGEGLRLRPWHCVVPALLLLCFVDRVILPSDIGSAGEAPEQRAAQPLAAPRSQPARLQLRSIPAAQVLEARPQAQARSASPAQAEAESALGETRIELRLADVDSKTLRSFLQRSQSELVQLALEDGAVREYYVLDAAGRPHVSSRSLAWEQCREARSPKRRIWVQLDSGLAALRSLIPARPGFGDYLVIGEACSQRLWRQVSRTSRRRAGQLEIFLRGLGAGSYRVELLALAGDALQKGEGR